MPPAAYPPKPSPGDRIAVLSPSAGLPGSLPGGNRTFRLPATPSQGGPAGPPQNLPPGLRGPVANRRGRQGRKGR